MGAMAEYFGADQEHWEAVGYLHDYDYEKYPEEHLAHTEEPLRAEGVPEEDIRAILSHGYSICTDVEPTSPPASRCEVAPPTSTNNSAPRHPYSVWFQARWQRVAT